MKKAQRAVSLSPTLVVSALMVAGGLTYVAMRLPARVQIAEVGSSSVCPGFKGAAVTPAAAEPGSHVTVSCDYGTADIDCIKPLSLPNDFDSCTFTEFDGTKAQFDCIAPDDPGSYASICGRRETDACKAASISTTCHNEGSFYSVIDGDATAPTKPVVTPSCDGTVSKIKIAWTGEYAPSGFAVDISENADHANFYEKVVDEGKSTDGTGFVGFGPDNNDVKLVLDPGKKYYAWVFNGKLSPMSAAFQPRDCTPSPTPSPSSIATPPITFRHDSATCTSLTFTWDKATSASGYVVELSKNSNFSDSKTSGVLQSTYDRYTFNNLDVNTSYYARISQANVHDYPVYSKLSGVKTSVSCVSPTPTPSATLKPSPTVTPKPTHRASPSPLSSASIGRSPSLNGSVSPIPSIFTDDNTPAEQPTTQNQSLLARFVAWIFAFFGKN